MSYPMSALMPRDCICPALQEEAGEIARLFLISSDGLAAYIWSRMDMPGLSLEAIGEARYARTGTAFSFENCLVAVLGHRIAGMVHAFPMEEDTSGAGETDPVLRPYAELEDPGSLYISGLAVHDSHRGQGIGGELIECVYALARARGLPRVSLICFEEIRETARRPAPGSSLPGWRRGADGQTLLEYRSRMTLTDYPSPARQPHRRRKGALAMPCGQRVAYAFWLSRRILSWGAEFQIGRRVDYPFRFCRLAAENRRRSCPTQNGRSKAWNSSTAIVHTVARASSTPFPPTEAATPSGSFKLKKAIMAIRPLMV